MAYLPTTGKPLQVSWANTRQMYTLAEPNTARKEREGAVGAGAVAVDDFSFSRSTEEAGDGANGVVAADVTFSLDAVVAVNEVDEEGGT